MKKCFLFLFLSLSTLLMGVNISWNTYKKGILHKQKSIAGWCCQEKAEKLMDLIYEIHPKVCVEIGVFGGSSVYPMASALSFQEDGIIYAIDPWSTEECLRGTVPGNRNYEWWSKLDLEAIYQKFLISLQIHKVSDFCHVMRTTSKEALCHFADESIDILHIDGNHHLEDIEVSDAVMWLPKVKKGGYIWFDDANWPETKRAVQFMKEQCSLDIKRSVGNDCYLFRKNK